MAQGENEVVAIGQYPDPRIITAYKTTRYPRKTYLLHG